MKNVRKCHYFKKEGTQIKQVLISWGKKQQSKPLPAVK